MYYKGFLWLVLQIRIAAARVLLTRVTYYIGNTNKGREFAELPWDLCPVA